jgi:signal transduction histidine kinase
VASRWRIRQKLLLGLGLVVALMALLMAGASYGLWSYYLTTNVIRGKLAELKYAEAFKEQVAALVAPGSLEEIKRFPAGVFHKTEGPRKALKEYAQQLEENLAVHRGQGDGEHERGLVEQLAQNLKDFEEAACRPQAQMLPGGADDAADADAAGEGGEEGKARPAAPAPGDRSLAAMVFWLRSNTADLRDGIYEELAGRLNETRRHYQVTLWIVLPASGVGLLLMGGLLRSYYAWVLSPIRALEAGVGRIAQGDFGHRIRVESGDEMEDLAAAFNDMARRLQELYGDLARQVNERSRQLVRSERLASVGFLAAGVAHEINNPLASIAFCSEALEARLGGLLRQARAAGRDDDPAVFAKYLKMIQEEAFRCKNITERLLKFSRPGERTREPADLHQLVQAVLELTQHLQSSRGKHRALEVGPGLSAGAPVTAWVNAEEIKSVVLNLVVNALDSMDEGGRLTIRLRQRDGMAELEFTDTGCGMTPEVLENIFEPFFTRSRTGKGTGLGLTISHQIITQHGGEIEAASPGPGRGSTFTVRLPVQPAEEPAVPAAGRRAA